MNRYRIAIGLLAALVVMVSVGVAVAVMNDDDMHQAQGGYAGMMGAMGDMDSDAMLARMQEVLGEKDYQRMLEHLQAHRSGTGTDHEGIDQMMHRMMDGIMNEMPMDGGGMMGHK